MLDAGQKKGEDRAKGKASCLGGKTTCSLLLGEQQGTRDALAIQSRALHERTHM